MTTRKTDIFNKGVEIDAPVSGRSREIEAKEEDQASEFDRLASVIGNLYLYLFHTLTDSQHIGSKSNLSFGTFHENGQIIISMAPVHPNDDGEFQGVGAHVAVEYDIDRFFADMREFAGFDDDYAFDSVSQYPLQMMKAATPQAHLDLLEHFFKKYGLLSIDDLITPEAKASVLTNSYYSDTAERILLQAECQGHTLENVWEMATRYLPSTPQHSRDMALCNGFWSVNDKPASIVSFQRLRVWADQLEYGAGSIAPELALMRHH